MRPPARYWNPYAAGIALGMVLLSAFLVVGRGLGASGAFVRVVAVGAHEVSPARAESNALLRDAGDEGGPLTNWLLIEIAGVMVGGAVSAGIAGRWRAVVERGPTVKRGSRLLLGFGGGVLMAFGARLARGCTSGQALSGGAVLSYGSWAFMIALFIGAYGSITLARRQWR